MTVRSEAAGLLAIACEPFAAFLGDPRTEDLAVNLPGEFWVRQGPQWIRHQAPKADYEWLEGLAVLAGSLRGQNVGRRAPILSTDVPGPGAYPLRLEVVLPPAVPHGHITLSFRRPGDDVLPVDEVASRYDTAHWNMWRQRSERRRAAASGLLDLYRSGNLAGWFTAMVLAKRTILFCGATGAGKTFLSRTLTGAIPKTERILTIEDALELVVPQPNHVRLLFPSSGNTLTPAKLLKAAMRLRPDRVMLQELRDPEAAWVYLNETMTGHPGSLTTIHGRDAPQAARRLFNLAKGSPEGASFKDETLADMLGTAVDAIVPVAALEGGGRALGEVWFADEAAEHGEGFADLIKTV